MWLVGIAILYSVCKRDLWPACSPLVERKRLWPNNLSCSVPLSSLHLADSEQGHGPPLELVLHKFSRFRLVETIQKLALLCRRPPRHCRRFGRGTTPFEVFHERTTRNIVYNHILLLAYLSIWYSLWWYASKRSTYVSCLFPTSTPPFVRWLCRPPLVELPFCLGLVSRLRQSDSKQYWWVLHLW